MKNASDGTGLRKETLSLGYEKQTFKLKSNGKRLEGNTQDIQELWESGNGRIVHIRNTGKREKERDKPRQHLKQR
jgi:hypothetical protein